MAKSKLQIIKDNLNGLMRRFRFWVNFKYLYKIQNFTNSKFTKSRSDFSKDILQWSYVMIWGHQPQLLQFFTSKCVFLPQKRKFYLSNYNSIIDHVLINKLQLIGLWLKFSNPSNISDYNPITWKFNPGYVVRLGE